MRLMPHGTLKIWLKALDIDCHGVDTLGNQEVNALSALAHSVDWACAEQPALADAAYGATFCDMVA